MATTVAFARATPKVCDLFEADPGEISFKLALSARALPLRRRPRNLNLWAARIVFGRYSSDARSYPRVRARSRRWGARRRDSPMRGPWHRRDRGSERPDTTHRRPMRLGRRCLPRRSAHLQARSGSVHWWRSPEDRGLRRLRQRLRRDRGQRSFANEYSLWHRHPLREYRDTRARFMRAEV